MRPYVIVHMGTSIDGRILTEHWGKLKGRDEYENTGSKLKGDAWMVGRVTMEQHFTSKSPMKTGKGVKEKLDRSDYVASNNYKSFAVAIDASGKLKYKAAAIDGDHIIAVLLEKVPDSYLHALRNMGVSYIFVGKKELSFELLMTKLRSIFNIKTLLLEGGGNINGSVIAAGLVDEISVIHFPVVDGTPDTPALFDITNKKPKHPSAKLKLASVKKLKNNIIWVRYKVTR